MSVVNWGASIARGCTAAMSVDRVRLQVQVEQLARAPDEHVGPGFVALLPCLERELRMEESVTEAVNCRALRSHLEQHARLLASLHQIEADVVEGNVTLAREALAVLQRWLQLQHAAVDLARIIAFTPMSRRRPFDRRRGGTGNVGGRPALSDRRSAAHA